MTPDVNLLVAAFRKDHAHHTSARRWLAAELAGGSKGGGSGLPLRLLPPAVAGFLRLVTNPKVFRPPSTVDQAVEQVDVWLASPQAHVLHSGSQHWHILAELSRKTKLQGGQFHDARIAAICIENSVSSLWSADRDFGRFKALKTVNPLV